MPTLASALILAASTPKKSSGGSSVPSLIFLVVIVGAGYFLFIRPRQAKARAVQSRGKQLSVGDDVVSIGGIVGRIVDADDDEVQVEVSPGVVMTFLRRAVNPRVAPTPPTTGRGFGGGFGGAFGGGRRQSESRPVEDDSESQSPPDPHDSDAHDTGAHDTDAHDSDDPGASEHPDDRPPHGGAAEGPAEDR